MSLSESRKTASVPECAELPAAVGSRQPSVAEKKLSFQMKGSKEPTGHFVATANKILAAEHRRSLMSLEKKKKA